MGKRKTDTRKCYAIKWKTSDAHSDLYSYSKDGEYQRQNFNQGRKGNKLKSCLE